GSPLEGPSRVVGAPGLFEGQSEMEERESMAFGEIVARPDLRGLCQGSSARFQAGGGLLRSKVREPPERQTHVVERHAARDLAFRRAPGQRLLEERDRLGQLALRLAQLAATSGQVVQPAVAPAGP